MTDLPATALFTDHYELTMLTSALHDGSAARSCVFEVFGRRLPGGRRYGVVAGTGRLVDALENFRFTSEDLDFLEEVHAIDAESRRFLAGYRFSADVDGYAEGELYFPGSPVLTVSGTFAEAVIAETLILSILNHDCAIASAAARMVTAAGDRPIVEMGSRRAHEEGAVASARAAYLAGFAASSNLAAGRQYGVPTRGTAAHAFTLLHDSEEAAFAGQIATFGTGTTLLVDTYDITAGIQKAIDVAGPELAAIRIDSGDLAILAHQSRAQLDSLGAVNTQIIVSGDLDEYAIASLAAAPVDAYGAGTSVVTGSGHPTAGMVYKLVEVDGRPVAKRSPNKASAGGRKVAVRRHKPTGTAYEEFIATQADPPAMPHDRPLQHALMRRGERVALPSLTESRDYLRAALVTLPWEGLSLSQGDPAIPVVHQEAPR